ncbi:MAG: hypothetical protein COT84_04225 [Chlamydiae bacterium CG10_big_fil_rev_8_21_14_0_10_35_9]|nr:MAG: hypothetical protein COT84_04225 [Chlamydiae bacterium CG10_big_fil_rev_8_21_14_0_10_35_9]
MSLKKGSVKEKGLFKASKWLHYPILCDPSELEQLFALWERFSIYSIGKVHSKNIQEISRKDFLSSFTKSIENLKKNTVSTKDLMLPAVITEDKDCLYQYSPKENYYILKVERPVIQCQLHKFRFSHLDGSIRSMVFSNDSVFWGIQFSFPTLFQDPFTNQIVKVDETFSNAHFVPLLRKWMRQHTFPVHFLYEDKILNSGMRLGKKCFSWINNHPELQAINLSVQNNEKKEL